MGRLRGVSREGLVQGWRNRGASGRLCGMLSAIARAACAATVRTSTSYIRFPE